MTGKTNCTLLNWEAQRYCFPCAGQDGYTLFESTLIRSHCLVSVIYTSRKALEAAGQRATALHFSFGTFWRCVDTADSGRAASTVRLCVNKCHFILALLPWVYQTWQKPCTHQGVCTFFNRRGFCRAICVRRGIIKLAGDLQTRGMQYCKWYQYQVNTRPVSLILIPIQILYTDKSSLCTFLTGPLPSTFSVMISDRISRQQNMSIWLLLSASLSHVTAWQHEDEEGEQSVQPRCERSSEDMSSLWWNGCMLEPTQRREQLNPPYWSHRAGIDLLSFERIIKEALLSTVHEILDQLVQFVYRLSRGVYDATSTLQNHFASYRGN